MPIPFIPRPYQELAIDFMINNPRSALWAGMGMGKTSSSLAMLDRLFLSGYETKPALVLAPLRVAKTVWPGETEKWNEFSNIEVQPIIGNPDQRLRALYNKNASVFSINYDNIPWLVETLGDKFPFGAVIADESTRLKNLRVSIQKSKLGNQFMRGQGGIRTKALAKIAHKATRWHNLTGTPQPRGLMDLWGQTWFLDYGYRLGSTFTSFDKRWFKRGYDGFSVEPLPHAMDEIKAKLKDICLTLDPKDWFDLKEPIVNIVEVDLPPRAQQIYKDMQNRMFAEIAGNPVEAFNAAAKTIKCLQIANGAAYLDDKGTWAHIHDGKIEALESIVQEAAGMPVLVSYFFKPDLARLKKAFPDGLDLSVDKDLARAKKGQGRVWFGHPSSIGHGVDGLQNHSNIIAFFSMWWDMETHDQIIERIGAVRQMQAGFDRPVFIHYILARGTIDYAVLDKHKTKRDTQEILMNYMKQGVLA